ncbi:MAG: hypothetical protein AAGJ81_01445 [Verrucomicrobiota bacterium]
MRKRRSDSVLFNLPETTQRAIAALEVEHRLSGTRIREILLLPEGEEDEETGIEGFGLEGIGVSAVYAFLKEWRVKLWREGLKAQQHEAQQIVAEGLADNGAVVDQAIEAGLREMVMDALANKSMDPGDIKNIFSMILKSRDQALDSRRLELLEKKAAQADEAKKVTEDKTLTPEEKQAKHKQIFGIG